MKSYDFVIRLIGNVEAESYTEAEALINKHLDDLGKVKSSHLSLHWPDCEYDIENSA